MHRLDRVFQQAMANSCLLQASAAAVALRFTLILQTYA